jgi:hypothetical protein
MRRSDAKRGWIGTTSAVEDVPAVRMPLDVRAPDVVIAKRGKRVLVIGYAGVAASAVGEA